MKKIIITVGLILVLLNHNAFAINYADALSISNQLSGARVELYAISKDLVNLNLAIKSANISDLLHAIEYYRNFCHCQANVLFLYFNVVEKKRKKISPFLYKDLFATKPLFKQTKKIFLYRYSELKNKSALHLADKAMIKINEIENLFAKLLDIYRSQ